VRYIGAIARMFDRDAAKNSLRINIDLSVLIQVSRLGDLRIAELDVERIGLRKVFDLHGRKSRSKNALCTVSPSGNSITRKNIPPASGIAAQKRILLSRWDCLRIGC